MSGIVVDSVTGIGEMLDAIEESVPQPSFLFVDLEGVKLSRYGKIAIMQVLVPPSDTVYLVDVHVLQKQAFLTPNAKSLTLKTILESTTLPKVFFDIRRDSDALYHQFQISLECVIDVQLFEFATRPSPGSYVQSLSRCISELGGLSLSDSRKVAAVKELGLRLFAPERGGSYEVFLERPLSQAIIEYCVQDVTFLPRLLMTYASRLPSYLAPQVHREALARVALSQSPGFSTDGPHMARGPSFVTIRTRGEEPLSYPMSVVCSGELRRFCEFRPLQAGKLQEQDDLA